MSKLSGIVEALSAEIRKTQEKNASADRLSNTNSSPSISTELGVLLVKTASLLKEAEAEISYEDVLDFVRRAQK